jgi:hypothetical protein
MADQRLQFGVDCGYHYDNGKWEPGS